MRKAAGLIGSAAVIGLVAGVLLDVVMFLVARYGPQADSWSFRGNGALAAFALAPALLSGFWAALVLRYRGFAHWALVGVAAGLVGTSFLLTSVLVLVLFNSAAMGVSDAMTFFILGWMVGAPVLAGIIPLRNLGGRHDQLPGHISAGVIVTVALVLAFFAASLVLAPGS